MTTPFADHHVKAIATATTEYAAAFRHRGYAGACEQLEALTHAKARAREAADVLSAMVLSLVREALDLYPGMNATDDQARTDHRWQEWEQYTDDRNAIEAALD